MPLPSPGVSLSSRLKVGCLARPGILKLHLFLHTLHVTPVEVNTRIPALNCPPAPPEPCSQGRYSLSASPPAAPASVSESESWKGGGGVMRPQKWGLGRGRGDDTRVPGKGCGWEVGEE